MSTLLASSPSSSLFFNRQYCGEPCHGSSSRCTIKFSMPSRWTSIGKGVSQAGRRDIFRQGTSFYKVSSRTQRDKALPYASLEPHEHQCDLETDSSGDANSSEDANEASETVMFSSALLLLSIAESPPAYSQASYYTSLGLFLLSLPGLWSIIKRSTKSKIVRRTFLVPGPKAEGARSLKQIAGEITAVLTKSNFKMVKSGETTTFEALFLPNRGQAAFITFCAVFGLGSLALVLSVVFPDIGEWWYAISLLGPAAGVYYWKNATRTEQVQVKMIISDNELEADVMLQGDEDEVERVRKAMSFMEKDKIYVKGLLEQS